MSGQGQEPEITTGEIDRRLDRFEKTVAEGFLALGQRIDRMGVVHIDTYEADKRTADTLFASIDRRISDLEQARLRTEDKSERRWQAWVAPIFCAVVAALLVAIVVRGGT